MIFSEQLTKGQGSFSGVSSEIYNIHIVAKDQVMIASLADKTDDESVIKY